MLRANRHVRHAGNVGKATAVVTVTNVHHASGAEVSKRRTTNQPKSSDPTPLVADGNDPAPNDPQPAQPVELPEDLGATTDDGGYQLGDEELAQLHEAAQAEFDGLYDEGTAPDTAGLTRANELVDIIENLRNEQGRRDEERQEAADEMAQLRQRVHGDGDGDGDGEPAGDGDAAANADGDGEPALAGEVVADGEPALVAGAQRRATVPVDRQRLDRGRASLNHRLRQLANSPGSVMRTGPSFDPSTPRRPTVDLATAQRFAPNARVPQGTPREEAVLVAASDIPNYQSGTPLGDYSRLADAMVQRAKSVTVGRSYGGAAMRHPVAYLEREHAYQLPDRYDPATFNDVLVAATNPEVLVAAGGWCAPPTTSYDFYNIVCEDGEVDLPTVGVPRGSMQWPVSPSFGDIMGLDDNPWTWTNQDDIEAAGTNGPEKPCQRIPCPDMDDAELTCDGICLTVGNLTDFAWPELVENHTRLLMAAQTHYMNMRKIQSLVQASVPVSPVSLGAGVAAPLLNSLALQAWDLREKYRMCNDAILELILPRWIIGLVQADMTLRQGLSLEEAFAVTMNFLADWLDVRNLRAQFVSDWQIGGPGQLGGATPATAWPTSVQALMYPPGTFILGQGLRLNLGVIRDSVLNRTNDHTAAWMEECYLIGKVGHESRLVDIEVCPNGMTNSGAELLCIGS